MMKAAQEFGLSREMLSRLRQSFAGNDKHRLAQAVASRSNLHELCLSRSSVAENAHVFNLRLAAEGKPVTNQRASGRCWIFACLNVMRLPLMRQLRMDEFELSQNFLFFWDKVERCYFNINTYLECARAGEAPDGRLVQHLLREPAMDGGQWDMLVNLVEKHGVMPKACWTEAWSCENSRIMNAVLESKLREYCHAIYSLVGDGKSDDEIRGEPMQRMMDEVYAVVSICLGTPPEEFTFEYYASAGEGETEKKGGKGKVWQKIGPISPREFYRQYVKPSFDMEEQVCLVHDPRPQNPFLRLYSVDRLGNMVGGRRTRYLNLPVERLKALSGASLRRNRAVWFGCHVSRHYSGAKGVNSPDLFEYELLLGTRPFAMDKARRLTFGDSLMTHAMVLTAAHTDGPAPDADEDGEAEANGDVPPARFLRWRVENSWGADSGCQGYICMSDAWFDEYVYEVVVERSLLAPDEQRVLDEGEITVLPAWDPMGALAKRG